LGVPMEAIGLRNHHGALHPFGGFDDFEGVFGVRGQRLLQEHVFARFEGLYGYGGMEVIGDSDGHGIDIRLFEQFFEIDVTAGDFETLTGFLGPFRMGLRQGHCCSAGTGKEAIEMFNPNGPCANHCTT